MKTTKKLLGILLAVVMLLNVVALSAFAAMPADTAVQLIITPNKTSYETDEIATFTVSVQTIPSVGKITVSGCYSIEYDSTVLAPLVSTDPSTVTEHNVVVVDSQLAGYDAAGSQVNKGSELSWVAAPASDIIDITLVANATPVYVDATAAPVDLFTFDMKVIGTTGTHAIGFCEDSYANWVGYINCDDGQASVYYDTASYMYGVTNNFAFGHSSFSIGAAGPAVTVANRDVKCQYKNAAAKTGFQLGFSGTISGMAIDAAEINADDNYTGTKLTGFGVVFTTDASLTADTFVSGAEGVTDSACETLYASGADYTFRAVVGGADKTSTATLYYRTYVTYDGVVYYSDIANTTANAEYLEAVTAGIDA